jgi:hypothetical protein
LESGLGASPRGFEPRIRRALKAALRAALAAVSGLLAASGALHLITK